MTAPLACWLAPLRGVTIRAFRETFAAPLREAGFAGAYAPFIAANPGLRVTDRLLDDLLPFPSSGRTEFPLVPQVIGKHPRELRELLKGFKDRGFTRADLNAGCPFPMIRRKGRGSGLLATPDVLERMLEAGCEEMGPGNFSLKTRLGMSRPDELLALLPRINRYPLAVLTVHARTARQMYTGACDWARAAEIAAASANPVMLNGDLEAGTEAPPAGYPSGAPFPKARMVGRMFLRGLGERPDARDLLAAYLARAERDLCGDNPVLGRIKELLAYWSERPAWRRTWSLVKICRSVDELRAVLQLTPSTKRKP